MLDDDKAIFGVLEGGDEEAADKTEDEDVAFHDRVLKKYNGAAGSDFTGGNRRVDAGCRDLFEERDRGLPGTDPAGGHLAFIAGDSLEFLEGSGCHGKRKPTGGIFSECRERLPFLCGLAGD